MDVEQCVWPQLMCLSDIEDTEYIVGLVSMQMT